MLEEILRFINNRFDRDKDGRYYGIYEGEFTVADGTLQLDGMLETQYFWVEGSALNDGLHLYKDTDLRDETFKGSIYKLVIPETVLRLAQEASEWCSINSKELNGPYQSESFGGYSYSLKQGESSSERLPASSWQVQFGARLRPYRKINRDWV